MQIGFIGLGRMGQLMVEKLLAENIEVVGFNRTPEITKQFTDKLKVKIKSFGSFTPAYSLDKLADSLRNPRIIWIMVKAGKSVDEVIQGLLPKLSKGDIVVDAGNSYFKDSIRRFNKLDEKGIHFLDVGTSGGIYGAASGFCFMAGGEKEAYIRIEPILKILGKKQGFGYVGPTGAGHFVKMVHNGIEYGMLEAIGEGFSILNASDYNLSLPQIAKIWNNGSVVRSWLIELLEKALSKDPKLTGIEGVIGGGETGRWTVDTAHSLNISVPAIEDSLKAREDSQKNPTFSGKVIAALRREFGGHEVAKK